MAALEYDIIIPVHKKDLSILEHAISQAKKNLIGARRVIVVSKARHTHNAEWFSEDSFPFSFKEISKFTDGVNVGWHFQQFLKIYAPLVIPDISENILILDGDTVFFKKTKMLDDEGRAFCNISKDTRIECKPFDMNVESHIRKLFPPIAKENMPDELKCCSGVSHHMIFNRQIIIQLLKDVEDFHYKKTGTKKPFYELAMMTYKGKAEMELSEYQIYFNYAVILHSDKIILRRLKYKNTSDPNIRRYRFLPRYDYCSFHHYLRGTKNQCLKSNIICKLQKLYKKLFLVEKWNIGVAKCNISEFVNIPNQEIKWLRPFRKFRADPFGLIDAKNNKQIFFENYDLIKRKGEIKRVAINDDFKIIDEAKVLEDKQHLSYPYIFHYNDNNYALVESYKANGLDLYKIDENNNFTKEKRLISNLKIVDPSIIKHDDKWWIFFTQADQGDAKLYIAYSDDLFGEWKMHKNNPVKEDIGSARMAGEIFSFEGSLYRPSQNCTNSYGGSIAINKISELSEENFHEAIDVNVTSNQFGKYPLGLHNISSLGEGLTLIDGKRLSFVLHKFLFSWIGLIYRCVKKCK